MTTTSGLHSVRQLSAVALAIACLLFGGNEAVAQTAEQLRQLQELSPQQREMLLEALNDQKVVRQSPNQIPEPDDDEDAVEQPESESSGVSGEIVESAASSDSNSDELQDEDTELAMFGYDLFADTPSTFAPVDDMPVPADYVVGPGDTIEMQLFGNESAYYSLVVTRDGILNVPDIGPISVAGLEFDDLRKTIDQRIKDQLIGVKASITMGRLRAIRVFILGNAVRPGSYTVGALSTMTNALFSSGGVSDIGSLRNIQLKRSGKVVATLDLYDLLLHGDTSGDARLEPGDVIYIPPIGPTAGIEGDVRRPAIYELRGEQTVADVLALAEGLVPTAYPRASQIARIDKDRNRTIIDVDLTVAAGMTTEVAAGDLITIRSVLEKQEGIVQLAGHVYREGAYQWRDGMRLSDLVKSARDLKPKADVRYVLIRREEPSGLSIETLSADLTKALAHPGSDDDVRLEPRDRVIIFGLDSDRRDQVDPILEELRLQSSHSEPAREVRVSGRVRAPGSYPMDTGMRVSDLLRAGGDLDEAAYMLEAELSRHSSSGGQRRRIEFLTVDITALLAGDAAADFALQPYDVLTIKKMPLWLDYETIRIDGEVRFPGSYPIKRGERLSAVVERAGGLTDLAFAKGAVFLREELRLREEQQLESLAERLESEIAASATSDEISRSASAQQELLRQVRSTDATGRLVIDLEAALAGGEDNTADILLRSGDELLIPRTSQTVTVIGEVQHPTSHVLQDDLTHKEYIRMSGGMTSQADARRIYVVRANGSVVSAANGRLRNRRGEVVYPGDTIVVPVEADPVSKMALWTSVSTIVYNIGVAAAAVASF